MTSHRGTFGERLRAYRAAAGLSQEDLAARSAVSVRAIGDMERGRTRWPHRDSVRRLADALQMAGEEREGLLILARRPVDGLPTGPGPVPLSEQMPGALRANGSSPFSGRDEATARALSPMPMALASAGLADAHPQVFSAGPPLRIPALMPAQTGPASPAVPRELPARVSHFTGRSDELRTLTRYLTGPGDAGPAEMPRKR